MRGDLRVVPFAPNIDDELREGPVHSNQQKFSFGKRLGSRWHWMLGRCYIGLKSSEMKLFGTSIESAFGEVALRSTLSEVSSTAISGSLT